MPAREIRITDEAHRDAKVVMEPTRWTTTRRMVGPGDSAISMTALVKVPEKLHYEPLIARFGSDEALADALAASDPDVDLELTGRRVGPADRVWVRADGSVLYTGRVLQVVTNPDGSEKERKDFVDVEATVEDDSALPWSGRLFPVDEVVHRFALTRKLQIRHVDGLTYEFLHGFAKTLQERRTLLLVGAGPGARKPLIFQKNGSPYRGFLEGRVDETRYRLVLHLSNLELKRP
ncbi:MAG: hypothetical protein U1F43_12080 [Myxococcota bacterium]